MIRSALLAFGTAIALSACAPGPDVALRGFDPVRENLGDVRIATRFDPPQLDRFTEIGLTLSARHPDGRVVRERFRLRSRPLPESPNGPTLVHAFAPDDLPRLAALRQMIAAWRAEAPETDGTLALAATICDPAGTGVLRPDRASLWVERPGRSGFVRVIDGEDLTGITADAPGQACGAAHLP